MGRISQTHFTTTLLLLLLLSPADLLHRYSLVAASSRSTSTIKVPLQNHEENHYYAAHLIPDADVEEVADELGMTYEGRIGELDDHHLFSLPRSKEFEDLNDALARRSLDYDTGAGRPSKRDSSDSSILYLEKQRTKRLHKRGLIPRYGYPDNDVPTLVSEVARDLQISDPLFPVQWHLLNPVQLGHDVNVTGVWKEGHFGENVTVAIVDDGLDMDSLDLKDNYFAAGSYDFNDHNLVPKPKLSDDQHGTRCAGEIAAVRNDVCGVGVAYKAKVAGLRILSADISDADEAIALNYAWHDNHIYSCSWGPPDDGKSMDAPGLLIKRAFVNGINKGRNGLGSIYVFASGNGGVQEDNCNFDGYTNSIYSITVGAVDRMGQHPYYSELCSAQMVVTYSSGSGDFIHTTDVGLQRCTDRHGGTSAAAPLAAGIFALALGIRPDLTWRDLQHLCVQTAQMVDDTDEDWETVTDGRRFNHKYGFGKLDAYKLVEAAKTFEHVKPQAWYHSEKVVVEEEVPDNTVDGLTSTVMVSPENLKGDNFEKVEHVQILMNLTHSRRGDIAIDLISPTGLISHICTKRKIDTSTHGMVGWYFMSVKHWGESGIGNWTIKVRDVAPSFTGTLHNWQLILWGSCIDATIAQPHPLPGTEKEPGSIETVSPLPQPTVSPPHETPTSTPTPTPSAAPSSEFWPWSSERKMLWIYGSIATITFFVSLLGVWYGIQRRKARLLRIHGEGREDYEFEVLPNEGGDFPQRQAGELYDAFVGEEEYLGKNHDADDEFPGTGRRRSGEVGDDEVGEFLADESDDEDELLDEKGIQRLLRGEKE